MRRFFATALLTILFLHRFNTEPVQGFQSAYRQIENGMDNAGVTLAIVPAGNAAICQLFQINKGNGSFAPEKPKGVITAANCNKASSPAELTLEYMAMQLPRSQAFQ